MVVLEVIVLELELVVLEVKLVVLELVVLGLVVLEVAWPYPPGVDVLDVPDEVEAETGDWPALELGTYARLASAPGILGL